jgi:hypothetical protein
MKILTSIIIFASMSLLQMQGQENANKTQQAGNQNTKLSTDTIALKGKHADVVVNMEMIESFRRCYDKIEVIDWSSILSNASSQGYGAVYTAYLRMQKMDNVNNDNTTLFAETEKVKNEVQSDTPIVKVNTRDKDTLANLAVKNGTSGTN